MRISMLLLIYDILKFCAGMRTSGGYFSINSATGQQIFHSSQQESLNDPVHLVQLYVHEYNVIALAPNPNTKIVAASSPYVLLLPHGVPVSDVIL